MASVLPTEVVIVSSESDSTDRDSKSRDIAVTSIGIEKVSEINIIIY